MKSFVRLAGAVAAIALFAGACTTPTSSGNSTSSWSVDPVLADAATTPDPLATNRIYQPVGTERGELAVMLHGTGSTPAAHYEIAGALRSDGYHVILLRYSASLGTLYACPDVDALTDPDCHRAFRHEVTFGAGVPDPDGVARDHATANVTSADSVVNRLLKLVDRMATVVPASGFGQFQQQTGGSCDVTNANYGTCELDWSKVSVLGHSQGAGVALYMAKFYALEAAGLLSGTYDAYLDGGGAATAAPWTTEGDFDVPAESITTLMHEDDYGAERIRAVADALGISGPEVSATVVPFLTDRLITDLQPTCLFDSVPGHNSTSVDLCTPGNSYVEAWRFMAEG